MSNLRTLLEYLICEENMYHTTNPKNVPSILSKGLKINPGFDKGGKSRGSKDDMEDEYDGVQPIFLSKEPGHYRNGEVLKVDVDGLPLVADIPGLADFGGEFTDHSVYWDEESTPEELWDLADPETGESVNGELEYEDLREPGPIANAAIDITKTAAVLEDIDPTRIEPLENFSNAQFSKKNIKTHVSKQKDLQEEKRIDDKYEYNELRFAKTPKKVERIKIKTPKKQIGKLGEFKLFLVDGEYVRNNVDIDFVAGGNPARYAYCPENEIWIEEVYDDVDIAATTMHEYHETILMRDHGKDYDKAHAAASKLEKKFRAWLDKHAEGKSQKELIAVGLRASKKTLAKKESIALNEAHLGKFSMDVFKGLTTPAKRIDYAKRNGLRELGEGSSRGVFALSTSKVLKIALPTAADKGRAQNEAEVSVWTNPKTKLVAARIFDFDPERYNWVIMEIAKPFGGDFNDKIFEKTLKVPYPEHIALSQIIDFIRRPDMFSEFVASLDWSVPRWQKIMIRDALQKYLDNPPEFVKAIVELVENNDLDAGDIHPSHFGRTIDGRIVLFDYGLTNEVYNTHYLCAEEE